MYRIKNIPVTHPFGIHATEIDEIGIMKQPHIEIKPIGKTVIHVSGGSMSAPFYKFKLDSGEEISDSLYNGTFKFMKNKTYIFKNAGISGVHPFKIGSSRGVSLEWVNGDVLNSNNMEIVMQIPNDYRGNIIYYCKNHSQMTSSPLSLLTKTSLGGVDINFYYGDIEVCVHGDFGITSYECFYHGYMGGENNLMFNEMCGESLSDYETGSST